MNSLADLCLLTCVGVCTCTGAFALAASRVSELSRSGSLSSARSSGSLGSFADFQICAPARSSEIRPQVDLLPPLSSTLQPTASRNALTPRRSQSNCLDQTLPHLSESQTSTLAGRAQSATFGDLLPTMSSATASPPAGTLDESGMLSNPMSRANSEHWDWIQKLQGLDPVFDASIAATSKLSAADACNGANKGNS